MNTNSVGAVIYSLAADGGVRLSPNFTVREFASKCGSDTVVIHHDLVAILQRIRDEFGPVTILSGYRSPRHNAAVGGAPRSTHMQGLAADITVRGLRPAEVHHWLTRQNWNGGLGSYSKFTHVDVGPRRRW